MYVGLLHLHSLLRWVIIISLVWVLLQSIVAYVKNKPYSKQDKIASLVCMSSAHLQFIFGLILYFISPIVKNGFTNISATMKDAQLRYWTVEHIVGMLLVIVCITMGYSLAKRASTDKSKHRKTLVWYGIAGLILFATIGKVMAERGWF